MANVIEFRNITKYFPGVKALDDISFVANGGEVLALMGENGAGKSTLLKILNGDYQQTSGQYLVNGEPCTMRGRKLRPGDVAALPGVEIIIE